jgi:hypothetical protein
VLRKIEESEGLKQSQKAQMMPQSLMTCHSVRNFFLYRARAISVSCAEDEANNLDFGEHFYLVNTVLELRHLENYLKMAGKRGLVLLF